MGEECLVLPLWLHHPVPLWPPLLSPPPLPLLQRHSSLFPFQPQVCYRLRVPKGMSLCLELSGPADVDGFLPQIFVLTSPSECSHL